MKEHYDIEVSYLEGPSARVISGCQDANTKLVSWIHVEQHTMNACQARSAVSAKRASATTALTRLCAFRSMSMTIFAAS